MMLVHLKIIAPGFMGQMTWDMACGVEGWNGLRFTENLAEVTCDECIRADRKKREVAHGAK